MANALPVYKDPKLLNRLLDSVRAGETFTAAGAAIGVSGKYAAELCRKHGVDRVPRSKAVLTNPSAVADIRASAIEGVTYAALAKRYGLDRTAMSKIAHSLGLPARPFTRRVTVPIGTRSKSLRCVGADDKVSGVIRVPAVCERCQTHVWAEKSNFLAGKAGCAECRKTFGGNCDGQVESMFRRARKRAAEKGVSFSLRLSDISIPEVCPVLGTALYLGTLSDKDNSPSLDRINPAVGYEPGNVWVISYRANRIKNDATLAELKAIVNALEQFS